MRWTSGWLVWKASHETNERFALVETRLEKVETELTTFRHGMNERLSGMEKAHAETHHRLEFIGISLDTLYTQGLKQGAEIPLAAYRLR